MLTDLQGSDYYGSKKEKREERAPTAYSPCY